MLVTSSPPGVRHLEDIVSHCVICHLSLALNPPADNLGAKKVCLECWERIRGQTFHCKECGRNSPWPVTLAIFEKDYRPSYGSVTIVMCPAYHTIELSRFLKQWGYLRLADRSPLPTLMPLVSGVRKRRRD